MLLSMLILRRDLDVVGLKIDFVAVLLGSFLVFWLASLFRQYFLLLYVNGAILVCCDVNLTFFFVAWNVWNGVVVGFDLLVGCFVGSCCCIPSNISVVAVLFVDSSDTCLHFLMTV